MSTVCPYICEWLTESNITYTNIDEVSFESCNLYYL